MKKSSTQQQGNHSTTTLHVIPSNNNNKLCAKEAQFTDAEVGYFRHHLITWYRKNRRLLPWRGDIPPYTTVQDVLLSTQKHLDKSTSAQKSSFSTNTSTNITTSTSTTTTSSSAILPNMITTTKPTPYASWVSEIMLQQTRVETVIKYYTAWLLRFPTIQSLANATEEDVNKQWAGLGYYRRARYLHQGAKHVVDQMNGILPSDILSLKKIPGIGPYTAGAISSIAFNRYENIVDGNVIRVLSRIRALGGRANHKGVIQTCWTLTHALMTHHHKSNTGIADNKDDDSDKTSSGVGKVHLRGDQKGRNEGDFVPGDLNQGLMELGATICSSNRPKCHLCPVQKICRAYSEVHHIVRKEKNQNNSSIVIEYENCDRELSLRRAVNVMKYPYPKRKKRIKEESIHVTIIEWIEKKSNQDSNNKEAKFLLLKRPNKGLLAGQWEFPSCQNKSSSSSTSFRNSSEGQSDTSHSDFIKQLLPNSTFFMPPSPSPKDDVDDDDDGDGDGDDDEGLSRSTSSSSPSASSSSSLASLSSSAVSFLGSQTHLFSHVKHHMNISHVLVSTRTTTTEYTHSTTSNAQFTPPSRWEEGTDASECSEGGSHLQNGKNGKGMIVNHSHEYIWMTLNQLNESSLGQTMTTTSKTSNTSNTPNTSATTSSEKPFPATATVGGRTVALTTGMRKVLALFMMKRNEQKDNENDEMDESIIDKRLRLMRKKRKKMMLTKKNVTTNDRGEKGGTKIVSSYFVKRPKNTTTTSR